MQLDQKLLKAECSHPFQYLGVHHDGGQQVVRVIVPGAEKVTLISYPNGSSIGEMQQRRDTPLFQLAVNEGDLDGIYELKVKTKDGEFRYLDPYQFQEHAYHAVHFVDHHPENIYQQLGAQLTTVHADGRDVAGVRFAVYAPNASAVSVVGDFNWWDGVRHPMQKTDMGYWVLFIPGVRASAKYKYQIKDNQGHALPHKADPVGFYADQYPSHASEVYDHTRYEWEDMDWMQRDAENLYQSPMSIYEVHLGSWRQKMVGGKGEPLNYHELADTLIPYVKGMGYTHIELLPVTEHPFDGSWGYQPIGLFAPTSRFGSPDDFKFFVDQCHQNGIGVIMDWVPAHFPEDPHGLARFDGSCVYEYEDPRKGWHPDWNSCIYDYGKNEVRQFLVANALYWLDKFHIDGLRVDAVASMLYLDYSRKEGEWIPNVDGGNRNYEAISLLQWMNREVYDKFPKAFTIAEESTAFPKVSRPVHEGGLGFGFKWNMGWMHDSLHFISKDPAYRHYHHNEITFSLIYAFDENFVLPISHDEVVHGKGSLIRKMPGDEWQQAANLRCYAAFMYAHPGKKLNFMGNEFGQSEEWNHSSSLSWHLLEFEKHQGIQQTYQVLNGVYRDYPALHQLDSDPSGFEWIDNQNSEQSVLSFLRRSVDDAEHVVVISNFTPVPRENYRIGVHKAGKYKIIVNTDDVSLWGSGFETHVNLATEEIMWNDKPRSIVLNLPPLATLYLVIDA
ncbi:1,4-alpha-glucan branching protein GlgB [Alteromonas sp. a30]|uniref:1,4-alpha-glucan branching protein GlgB n=1 Tax=Alteromonas sp. a30 TaxID=2730917 RepID=UPI0022822E90|nr:1,4-alpha-glucan branching protein GlgB [Alteromonas sp. a30]MCY7294032.1 1,4-alpha-glucan branching protein GlgB [Alteromonas sp. a30]